MLTWLAVCCQQPTITTAASNTVICSGQSATITGGGAGIGATYTITPGGILSNSAVVSPTVTTLYTIAGTNTNACQGTQTVLIIVNPTPTVNPGSNGPICKGSVLNLTCNPSAGNPVTYNWVGPNGYTSPFQNPQVVNAQPTLTGVYVVNVTSTFSSGVCSNSGTTSVVVVNSNSIAVSDHTVCHGAPLTLTAGVLGATSCSWTGPNSYTSNVQNPPSFPAAPINAGDYSVTATFSALGTTLTCNSGAVSNVSVVATSPVTLTIPTNVCEKQNVVMTASANPAPLTYFWTGPNGFLATGTNTNITGVIPSQGGLYNVLATWAIGNVSCSINGAAQMNVVPVPDIAVISSTAVCYPANVSLTSSAPGAVSYSWTGPNSFNSSIPNPLLTAPGASATGIYTVTTAFTNGQIICLNSNTTQVTVNPALPFTLEPYKQLCSNSTYSMSGPAGATSYTWLAAGGYTNNNQVLIIPNMQPVNAGTYTLIASLGPCQTMGTTKLDILSPISFSLTPGNHTVCEGDSLRLIMGSSGGSQNYAYVWNPAQWLSAPTGSAQWAHPNGTTIYNVMGYDIACPQFSINTSFTITVKKGPQPQLDLGKAEGCEPLCLKLNSKTQEDATQVTYDFGNGELMQADDFTYCLNQPGTYKLKAQIKGKNGCTMNYEHPAPIVVHPNPHTELYWTPDPATTTQNNVTFLPTHQYGPVVEYGWEFAGTNGVGGYDTSSLKNPVRVYENIGKYPVLLISKTDKGCIDTVYKILEVRDEFTIYIPNTFTPNNDNLNDVFNIKGIGLKMEGYSMEIFDRWGNLVYSTKDVYKGWDGTIKGLNAENGVYVYKVKALGANGEGKKEYVGHVTLLK
jgi:gliding motility-associated-like protein